MTTIREVAREAGVSVATVSRVLNKNGQVAEDTALRVHDAVKRLNFQPNTLARSLITGQSATIGLIVPDISNPAFPMIARGVADEAQKNGFSVILCNSYDDVANEVRYLNVLRQKKVDGILVTVVSSRDTDHLERLAGEVPIVLLGRSHGAVLPAVVANNRSGSADVTRHLLDLGHTRITVVGGPEGVSSADERVAGTLDALEEKGLGVPPEWLLRVPFEYMAGYRAGTDLVQRSPGFTAVIAGNDLIALGCLQALRDRQVRVPEDVAVVGFDDIPPAMMLGLTTVQLPSHRMGSTALRILLEIKQGKRPPGQVTLGVKLITRQTCGAGMQEEGRR